MAEKGRKQISSKCSGGVVAAELFVLHPSGMAATRLRTPSEKIGTARNMNTVAKLAGMVAASA
jgi:uncharacterized protein (DUF1697 family)